MDGDTNNDVIDSGIRMHNFKPRKRETKKYCRSLVGIEFQGETSDDGGDSRTDWNAEEDYQNLGTVLMAMDGFIRQQKRFDGTETLYRSYLRRAYDMRFDNNSSSGQITFENFIEQSTAFQKLYTERDVLSDVMVHGHYWATRQQLLGGKVIADFLQQGRLKLDPIFGVLLCPCVGRTGAGDSGIMHRALFDNRGPIAYHSAVHDAFGYLIIHHDVGPGYNYLNVASCIFPTTSSLAGQIAGIKFWNRTLKKDAKRKRRAGVNDAKSPKLNDLSSP